MQAVSQTECEVSLLTRISTAKYTSLSDRLVLPAKTCQCSSQSLSLTRLFQYKIENCLSFATYAS